MNNLSFLTKIRGMLLLLVFILSTQNAIASDTLTQKEQAVIPIAAFTASGEIDKLKASLSAGLEAGLTINEIKEVIAQLYAYAGFPRSLNGLSAFMTVLDERKNQGIVDEMGPQSSPLPNDEKSIKFGTDNQTKLIGQEVKGPLFDFSPQIDDYLKSHLFGDIFERDLLSWKMREIATIAALSNINGVNSQLKAHYKISLNNNVSKAELNEFISILRTHLSDSVADNAQQVLNEI